MALMPKRTRYRKSHRGRMKGNATRGNTVAFGEYGIQALEGCWLPARTIEAARIAANRQLPKGAKLFIRVFPHKPISSKPLEVRMGKGKGDTDYWAAIVKPGTVLYEIAGATKDVARLALNRLAHKLPFRVRMVERRKR